MDKRNLHHKSRKAMLALMLAIGVAAVAMPLVGAPGAVYTMTNSTGSNAVVMYSRSADGTLDAPQFFATGGSGTGAGLGSEGALAISDDGHWVIAVDAGSNDVSVFSANHDELRLTDRKPSGGTMPISVTMYHDLVFVLNGGGTANISGFRLTDSGALVAIPGTTQVLPGVAPAQVSFANGGESLVVTEKNSNTISVYTLDDGRISGPFTRPSSGVTPFGFGVSKSDILIVSEATGGAPGGSTVSSYIVDDGGFLRPVTAALATGQTAACWVAVTQNGKYAYVANTGSSTLSSVGVGRDGSLELLSAVAGQTPPGTPAIDMALSVNSKYLYALAGGTISVFRVSADGSLWPVQVVTGLPASTAGLAAR